MEYDFNTTEKNDALESTEISEAQISANEPQVTVSRGKGYNKIQLIKTSILLLGPLIMGIAINSIGNDEYIKIHFAKMHNLSNKVTNITAEDFPSKLWSLGFLFPFGGLLGSLIAAMTVDKYGRKTPSLSFCVFALIGAFLKIFSRKYHVALLFLSRFFDGIAVSGLMVSAILLMFESLPERIERIFKPFIQIAVNLGIMLIGVTTLYKVTLENWNYVHILTAILSMILFLVILYHPESPTYVYNLTRDSSKTEGVFKILRGPFYDQEEVENLKKSIDTQNQIKQMTVIEFMRNMEFRLAIFSLIVLNLGQQFCGINAIMAFAPSLLKQSGFDQPDVGGVVISCIALIGSIIFSPFVQNYKRKLLWLIGFGAMAFSFSAYIIGQNFSAPGKLQLFWLCLFVFMFQIGPGPVCWFISVEMFPPNASGAAQGVAGFFNYVANSLVFLIFPIALEALQYNTLYIFILLQALIFSYSYFFVVETFKKSQNEVMEEYKNMLSKLNIGFFFELENNED